MSALGAGKEGRASAGATREGGRGITVCDPTAACAASVLKSSVAEKTPPAPGGADSALDLTTEKDRGLVRTATKRWPARWRGLSPEFKDKCVEQLNKAMEEVGQVQDLEKRVSLRASLTKTATLMVGQEQKDDHKEADLDQAERVLAAGVGQQGGPVQIVIVDVAPQPMPDARRDILTVDAAPSQAVDGEVQQLHDRAP